MLTLARMRQNMDLETYRADWLRLRDRLVAEGNDPEPRPASPCPASPCPASPCPASPSVEGGEAGLEALEDELGASGDGILQHYGEAMETAGDLVAPTADPGSTHPPEESTAPPSE